MLLTERPRPSAIRDHPKAGWLAVATVCFGAFMGQLDASIVTLTFPAVQQEFHAPLAAVEWVSLAYLLTLVSLLVAVGQLADATGRKLMYLHGFGLFAVASAACGLAPGLGWLVGFRVVQAVGAAMMQANSVALVVTSVPRQRMRSALGVQAAAQALGLALGPTVGGVLVASLGWQWVFLVNVPIGLFAWVAGRYLLPRTRERTPVGSFDWPGLLALSVSSVALLMALSGISGLHLSTPVILGLAAAAVVAAVGFGRRELRARSPLVDLAALRPPAVSWGLVGALCGYLVLFGPLTLFPQLLGARGSAGLAGLVLTALPAGFGLAAVTAERVLPRSWTAKARALVGAGITAAACAALLIAPDAPARVAGALVVMGLGLGVFIPANNSSIMAAIPARMSATGGGLVNMARSLGTALGVALVALCLHVDDGVAGARLTLLALIAIALVAGATGLAANRASPAGDTAA
jgi:MFS family permease